MVTITISAAAAATAVFRGVILGAPGSGKGTVSFRIIRQFNLNHISVGDKLRQHVAAGTEIGKKVKKYLINGSYVPDDIMISLIDSEIKALVVNRNYLLDGFPRTLMQAKRLQKLHPINHALNLVVPIPVILDRIKNRWVHLPSGRIYNIGFNDPLVPGKDDVTGEPLVQREDDKPEVMQRRLQEYIMKTEPVIQFYREIGILKEFHGNTTDEMWPAIKSHISQYLTQFDSKC